MTATTSRSRATRPVRTAPEKSSRDIKQAVTEPSGGVYIDALLAGLARAGDQPVLSYRGQNTSAWSLRAAVYRYARALADLGIERGSLVALFAPTSPDALAVRYAANLLGAAAVYLSAPPSPERRAELVARMDPQLLVVFAETADVLPDGAEAPVVTVGVALPGAACRLDERAALEPGDPIPSRARPGDLAVIVSSGGSTGVPKGSWRTFAAYGALIGAPSPADRRQLANGRLAYLTQVLVDTTLLGGGSVVLQDGYDAAETLATIEAERITHLFLVEPQLVELMDHPDVATRDVSSLRTVTHIGASAPAALRLRAHQRLGPVLAHAYGASEMGIVSSLSPAEHDPSQPHLFTSAGRIHPEVEVRFRRADGTLAAPLEPGSIEVRSPAMAGGYRNRPVEQDAAFQDGWYRSGDLGRLDAKGYLHVLGRACDVSVIDGEMVTPTTAENVLCRLPAVRYAVMVVDREAGSSVAAVVAWPGATVDPAACRAAIAAEHGDAAIAPLVVVPVDAIPLTEQGKPDRALIRRLAEQPH